MVRDKEKIIFINNIEKKINLTLYEELERMSNRLQMKSKGEKHSVSKVKKLNPVNVEEIESINEFVESVVTENRLQQGLGVIKGDQEYIDVKHVADFIRWMVSDVLKEETDTIVENGLNEKKVKNAVVNKSRVWFLNNF